MQPANPRYFTDSSGQAVYLTGAHVDNSLHERSDKNTFDFSTYLDFLEQHNHNFIRLWTWEQSAWTHEKAEKVEFSPRPYQRTGPGTANDGELKFDLTRFDQAYFDRLRARVSEAAERRIYVSVMLFQVMSAQKTNDPGNPWAGHPLNSGNNINAINGDPNGNGNGEEVHSLAVPAITALQEAFVRKVVDTLNDLDNVLYEVTREAPTVNKDWQYHIARYLKNYQAGKPKQHPVGISYFHAPKPEELSEAPADWVLIAGTGLNPTPAAGTKAVVANMNPTWLGTPSAEQWVWQSFTRGYNPIYMDPDPLKSGTNENLRDVVGYARSYSQIAKVGAMSPDDRACSTGYCLVNPGSEYLMYLPSGGNVRVKVAGAGKNFAATWFNPAAGETISGGTIPGGGEMSLIAPFEGQAVLHLLAVSGDFVLSNPDSISVTEGATATTNITASLVSETAGPVVFSAAGLPEGASALFSQDSCTPSCSTVLTIRTAPTTPRGVFTVMVEGASADRVKAATVTLHVTPPDAALAAKTGTTFVEATGNGAPKASQFSLLWEDYASDEDGFYIERKMEANGTYVRIAQVAANTTSYVDSDLMGGILYCYRVSAFNSRVDSDYSNEVCSISP
ncbi:MAG: DUF6298 domain-containing protein [Candidatus Binatia bacterium]